MKTIKKLLLGAGALLTMGLGACTDDLDLLPTDEREITAGTFQEDPEKYMNGVLADIYFNFAAQGPNGNSVITQFDGGMAVFQRALFILEEIPTDEACWLYSHTDTDYGMLQYGIPAAGNKAMGGCYARLNINISLCNDFIATVNDGLFGLPDNLQDKAADYVRQAKILRSACYFYMLTLFGNVPYADESVKTGAIPDQMSRAEVYDRVVSCLEGVVAEYNGRENAHYGFVGLDVAEGLLVKLYLNAGVFKGAPEWSKCSTVAKRVIARHQASGSGSFVASDGTATGLTKSYFSNFSFNNYDYANNNGNLKEIMWMIPTQNLSPSELKSYGGSTILLNAYAGTPTNDAVCDYEGRYNTGNGWSCMVARRQFTEVFEWNEDYTASIDDRVSLWCTAADGFVIDNPSLVAGYGSNGFAPIKYNNWWRDENGVINENLTPIRAPKNEGVTSYAMLRLAEIYLSAAEADLHLGNTDDALKYTNYIRQRAGLADWTAADLNLETLQQERQRELYSECTRRTDLIRYGKWTSGYTWNWKNNTPTGADFPAYYNLYPLPDYLVNQAGYTQNPGYSGN